MHKRVCLMLAVCLLLGAYAQAEEIRGIFTGWISDERCGRKHAKRGEEEAVKKCLKGEGEGAQPDEAPPRMVFLSDKDGKVWIVSNPRILEDYEGRRVRVRARMNTDTRMVRVVEVSTPRSKQ